MNLHEFLSMATFEGEILVKAWDSENDEEILCKPLDELSKKELFVYSWPVTYVYPIAQYVKDSTMPMPCIVIEVSR